MLPATSFAPPIRQARAESSSTTDFPGIESEYNIRADRWLTWLGRQFGIPKLDPTRWPKVDTVIKCNLSNEVKDTNSQLPRIHT